MEQPKIKLIINKLEICNFTVSMDVGTCVTKILYLNGLTNHKVQVQNYYRLLIMSSYTVIHLLLIVLVEIFKS